MKLSTVLFSLLLIFIRLHLKLCFTTHFLSMAKITTTSYYITELYSLLMEYHVLMKTYMINIHSCSTIINSNHGPVHLMYYCIPKQ
jgi:hypothetical protein